MSNSTTINLFKPTPFETAVNGDLKIWMEDGGLLADVFFNGNWFDLGSDADSEGDDLQLMLQGLVAQSGNPLVESDDIDELYVRTLSNVREPKEVGNLKTLPHNAAAYLHAHGWVMREVEQDWFNPALSVYTALASTAVAVQQTINSQK